jgi:hypothetical protein
VALVRALGGGWSASIEPAQAEEVTRIGAAGRRSSQRVSER